LNAKRGDQVEVANMRLAETPSIPIAEPTGWLSFLQFTKDDAMRGIELGVMALLGLLVLFFGVRPLLRRVMGTDQAALAAGGVFLPGATVVTAAGAAASGGPGVLPTTGVNVKGTGHGSITSTGGPNVALVGGDAHVNISNRTSAMIDIAQVQGQVHAESVKKVGELAERNPNETVAIIRTWLHESAA
jgi:flagellar M-ring protein FliF